MQIPNKWNSFFTRFKRIAIASTLTRLFHQSADHTIAFDDFLQALAFEWAEHYNQAMLDGTGDLSTFETDLEIILENLLRRPSPDSAENQNARVVITNRSTPKQKILNHMLPGGIKVGSYQRGDVNLVPKFSIPYAVQLMATALQKGLGYVLRNPRKEIAISQIVRMIWRDKVMTRADKNLSWEEFIQPFPRKRNDISQTPLGNPDNDIEVLTGIAAVNYGAFLKLSELSALGQQLNLPEGSAIKPRTLWQQLKERGRQKDNEETGLLDSLGRFRLSPSKTATILQNKPIPFFIMLLEKSLSGNKKLDPTQMNDLAESLKISLVDLVSSCEKRENHQVRVSCGKAFFQLHPLEEQLARRDRRLLYEIFTENPFQYLHLLNLLQSRTRDQDLLLHEIKDQYVHQNKKSNPRRSWTLQKRFFKKISGLSPRRYRSGN